MFEHAFTLKGPALEAEYAFDDRIALKLYDCLIPRLREHQKFKIRPDFWVVEKELSNWGLSEADAKINMMSLEF